MRVSAGKTDVKITTLVSVVVRSIVLVSAGLELTETETEVIVGPYRLVVSRSSVCVAVSVARGSVEVMNSVEAGWTDREMIV